LLPQRCSAEYWPVASLIVWSSAGLRGTNWGAEAWVQYCRHADLGTGLVAYPIEGIGTTLLLIATAISIYIDGTSRRAVTMPLYVAVALSVGGLLLTAKAAPIMLALASPQTAAAIQHAFDKFFFWGLYLRGSLDTLAFVSAGWSLSNLRAIE
jgi:hypothetical protein